MPTIYDRAAEDLGNSVHLEHVNVCIPDQRQASLFYVSGLGLTRDPYLMTADDNMWINVGRSQFHLPTAKAQRLRGRTGLVIPDREALLQRLGTVRPKLSDTAFSFSEHNEYVEAVCPWGNRLRVHEPDANRFGRITLGIPYVEFDVPPGTAKGIVSFYRQILDVPGDVIEDGVTAKIEVGQSQFLYFRETNEPLPAFDNHHIQIYVANFSGPYRKLGERNLVSQEDNRYQYRFRDIIDLQSGKLLFTIEHEVRSIRHPNYLRPLANRNPAQMPRTYAPNHDALNWSMGPEPMDARP